MDTSTPQSSPPQPVSPAAHRPQVSLVLAIVMLMYVGQVTLNPVIAPLAREIHLAEWQIGFMISAAAVMVAVTSSYWGKASQKIGSKKVMTIALSIGSLAMIGFALTAYSGMTGALAGISLFGMVVLLRGVAFGSGIAAIGPAAQVYITNVTPDEKTRVKGIASLGAVQGISMILGALIGGMLSAFGIMTAIAAVPLFMLCGLIVASVWLRPDDNHKKVANPPKLSPTDPRIWPYLLAQFGLFSALGFVNVAVGFLLQDRYHLSSSDTGFYSGIVLMSAGVGMVLSQGVIVPRAGWAPTTLIRIGSSATLLGFLLTIPVLPLAFIAGAMFMVGLGMGIAAPGVIAGPTLLMSHEEQGGMAGLTAATSGLTFIIAPTAGTALYAAGATFPFIVGAGLTAIVIVHVFTHPQLRVRRAVTAGEHAPEKP